MASLCRHVTADLRLFVFIFGLRLRSRFRSDAVTFNIRPGLP